MTNERAMLSFLTRIRLLEGTTGRLVSFSLPSLPFLGKLFSSSSLSLPLYVYVPPLCTATAHLFRTLKMLGGPLRVHRSSLAATNSHRCNKPFPQFTWQLLHQYFRELLARQLPHDALHLQSTERSQNFARVQAGSFRQVLDWLRFFCTQ